MLGFSFFSCTCRDGAIRKWPQGKPWEIAWGRAPWGRSEMEATTGWTEGKRWEMSLVLVDRDLHVENDVQLAPLRRFPMWIRYRHDRAPLLRELGLASLCDVRADQCHLWRNNVVIDEQSSSPLHISDGDLHQGVCRRHGSAGQQDTCLSDLGSSREWWYQLTSWFCGLWGSWPFSTITPSIESGMCELHPVLQHGPDPFQRPLHNFPGDFDMLEQLFGQDSMIECEEEGRMGQKQVKQAEQAFAPPWMFMCVSKRRHFIREGRSIASQRSPQTVQNRCQKKEGSKETRCTLPKCAFNLLYFLERNFRVGPRKKSTSVPIHTQPWRAVRQKRTYTYTHHVYIYICMYACICM